MFWVLALITLAPGVLAIQDWRTRSIYQVMTDRFAQTVPSLDKCHNLREYCNGTFKGLMNNLDHITTMGFNAIWISPIVSNTEHGYHGYYAKNLYEINPHFGTAEELKQLIAACHSQDVWVMLDVVANHMGNAHLNFSQFHPFNQPAYYHYYCLIRNYDDQTEVETCRIGDRESSLPDLNTEHAFVEFELNKWIKWVTNEFKFDGIRIDTVKHVRKDFWNQFVANSRVFAIGEVYSGNPEYVGEYQKHMHSLLNFPLYHTIADVFQKQQSMWNLETRLYQNRRAFQNTLGLGNFIDNHDVKRFMHETGDIKLLINALVYLYLSDGIPIVYQGTEYLFDGGEDPMNRESMWPAIHTRKPPLGRLLKMLSEVRSRPMFSESHMQPICTAYEYHVFYKAGVVVVVSNIGTGRSYFIDCPFEHPVANYVNILSSETEHLDIVTNAGHKPLMRTRITNGSPKIFVLQ